MPNSSRRRAIASLLARHSRLTDDDGKHLGCLCGAPQGRIDHYNHLAELVEGLIDEALDEVLSNRARGRTA